MDDKTQDQLIQWAQLAVSGTPAQQAIRLRRLVARHKGNLPLPALLRIWREMMGATAPSGRSVHVYAADRAGQFRDLARDFFGSLVTMKSHQSATAIVHECSGDAGAFGVVPPPESDEDARAWWVQLAPSGQDGPRVVAALPFDGAERAAYVIGSLDLEPSGDDTTMILLEAGDSLSLTKLQTLLKLGGLDAKLLAVSRDSSNSAARHHLLEVAGFVRDDDARLGALREQRDEAILRVVSVGCYANPLLGAPSP